MKNLMSLLFTFSLLLFTFLAGAADLPAEHHKDPADRMIIASALDAGLEVVTGDHNFPLYGVKTIK